jgi:hypothetical protein
MGNPVSQPVRVEDNFEDFTRDSLSIAALDSGYILVWYDARYTSAIRGQIVDFDGNLMGGNFPIRPDSTGSILGLECQNHPDGRVLVSWVTDQQYSRGRWLDANGSFMGDVFDMAEPYSNNDLVRSLVRFNINGTGMLYQYSDEIVWVSITMYKYSYITPLDSLASQAGERLQVGYWWNYSEDRIAVESTYYFPDVISLPDTNYTSITFYHWEAGYDHTYGNRLYSSVLGGYIFPWGAVGVGNYDLCQLDETFFMYAFSSEYIGLRRYEISTLDSSEVITWVYEPDFGTEQNQSDICVHADGSFRVIYNNWLGEEPQVYTRHFDAQGSPSSPDTLVSMNTDLIPAMTSAGTIEKTSDDLALVIWPYGGDILGTTYETSVWADSVSSYNCDYSVESSPLPDVAINNSDHTMLLWKRVWQGGWETPSQQLVTQAFQQLFSIYTNALVITPEYYHGLIIYGFSLGFRDNGNFLGCWALNDYGLSQYILAQCGNYDQLQGDLFSISSGNHGNYCGSPVVGVSENQYWVTWNQGNSGDPESFQSFLQKLDADGNLIGDPTIISEPDAISTGDPNLAVSPTGNFAIVWQDARDDEGDIYCRKFNPDGSFFGEEFKVNSDPPGALQSEPAVALGPDDQLYFTWTDFRNPGGQGDIYCKVMTWADSVIPPDPPEPPPLPYVFELKPPAPNPFNTGTKISYSIPEAGQVSLTVNNLLGREVAVLVNRTRNVGNYELTFNGTDLGSGVYILRLQMGNQITHQKLVLLK